MRAASDHTAKVLECFAKLTDRERYDNIYIQTKEAKTILKAGLTAMMKVCVRTQHTPVKTCSVRADLIYWSWMIDDAQDIAEYLDGLDKQRNFINLTCT